MRIFFVFLVLLAAGGSLATPFGIGRRCHCPPHSLDAAPRSLIRPLLRLGAAGREDQNGNLICPYQAQAEKEPRNCAYNLNSGALIPTASSRDIACAPDAKCRKRTKCRCPASIKIDLGKLNSGRNYLNYVLDGRGHLDRKSGNLNCHYVWKPLGMGDIGYKCDDFHCTYVIETGEADSTSGTSCPPTTTCW